MRAHANDEQLSIGPVVSGGLLLGVGMGGITLLAAFTNVSTASPTLSVASVRSHAEPFYESMPGSLDKAYLDGMARRDFKLSKTLGGWHLTGFLDIEVGTMLDTVLRNLSVPREAGDTRSPADRRMDGLEQFLKRTLEHGLPSDNGIRPHLSVVVTAETLKAIAKGPQDRPTIGELEPAVLHGFGPIGPVLLSVLLDDGQITPILVKDIEPNPEILDVGRTHRRATPRQARAITFRQNGTCASPGCHHPIAHNHHKLRSVQCTDNLVRAPGRTGHGSGGRSR